jgi:hypothetical protein
MIAPDILCLADMLYATLPVFIRQAGPLPQMVLRSYPRANRAHYSVLFTGMESGPSLTRVSLLA